MHCGSPGPLFGSQQSRPEVLKEGNQADMQWDQQKSLESLPMKHFFSTWL